MSRRVVVTLATLVGVLTLGTMGFLGAVSAAPSGTVAKVRTLTVVMKSLERKVVDLGAPGPTHGDMRLDNAPLYNASGKQIIGRFDLFCATTDPADKPAEMVHMQECMATFTLPGGEIETQSVTGIPKGVFPRSKGGVSAITGGTGKFFGVKGELRFVPRGPNFYVMTFHYIN